MGALSNKASATNCLQPRLQLVGFLCKMCYKMGRTGGIVSSGAPPSGTGVAGLA